MSHDYSVCRTLYAEARSQGAPVVHVLRLDKDTLAAQTDDGKIINESATLDCCKWQVKYETAAEWLKQHQPTASTP